MGNLMQGEDTDTDTVQETWELSGSGMRYCAATGVHKRQWQPVIWSVWTMEATKRGNKKVTPWVLSNMAGWVQRTSQGAHLLRRWFVVLGENFN